MGTTAQHQAKADHHLAFLRTIPDDFPDWLATVAFYAAVELVERLLAERDLHSKSHEDRNQCIRRDFRRIHKDFKALYNASLECRYGCRERCLSTSEVQEKLIDGALHHVQTFVASRSSPAGPKAPPTAADDGGPASG